jgi:hypothetical protein
VEQRCRTYAEATQFLDPCGRENQPRLGPEFRVEISIGHWVRLAARRMRDARLQSASVGKYHLSLGLITPGSGVRNHLDTRTKMCDPRICDAVR